ncbi:MAG: AAA family ATPase [Candidatus Promineofilum sp.]|nr:AAA family ATPase [Promineifilum sp.]MCW5864670.1 AAA family ATPase [Anaerolineae bacterium]
MAVRAFRLTNFMAFGEWPNESDGWIELRPITLLFGRNSSGKSVILRGLRFLQQSLDGGSDGSPFVYSARNGVDVGGFLTLAHKEPAMPKDAYVYRQSDESWLTNKRRVGFDFRVTLPDASLGYALPDLQFSPDVTELTVKLAYGWLADESPPRAGLMSASISIGNNKVDLFEIERLRNDPEAIGPSQWYFGSSALRLHEGDRLIGDLSEQSEDVANADLWDILSPEADKPGFLPQLTFPRLGTERHANADVRFVHRLLESIAGEIRDFLSSIEHVRPLRPEPKRIFLLDETEQEEWRQQGRSAYLQLLRDELPSEAVSSLNLWLSRLELGTTVKGDNLLRPTGAESGIRLAAVASQVTVVEQSGNEINLEDVGYGAGQVIPVIVQSVLARENTLTLIEQPELHLHPKAQAELGDLFIENAKDGVCFLIETHSEHLILRVMKRVREQKLDTNQTIVFYATRHDNGWSFIHRREMDAEGDFTKDWPEGFFPERFAELF